MTLHSTLVELLDSQVSSGLSVEFIQGQDNSRSLTVSDIRQQALQLLGDLQARGIQSGDELVIHTQSNKDFVIAFWAAVLGGVIPVPVAVGISDEHRHKLLRIVAQLKNPCVYTTADIRERLKTFVKDNELPSLNLEEDRWIVSPGAASEGVPAPTDSEKLAFIQYSSGSTGNPKGVCLTHKNVTTNIRAIVEAAGWTPEDRALSWMPLTHDMGLIGFHLSVLAAGMTHAIVDTNAFVRRPKLWLQLAAERNVTVLCSPNFGYQHYLNAVERKGPDTLDLSSVRQILNGAEPISRTLCDQFNATLAPLGLRATAMRPVYGLAEATVGVSFSTPDTHFQSTSVNRNALGVGATLERVDHAHADAIDLMHVGFPIRDVALRVVDDEDRTLGANTVGHLQLNGDSVTSGIYGDPTTTQALFTSDGWLRTGDTAALVDTENTRNELVIVGRLKDVLISSGQNFYAHDIEHAVSTLEGAELGKVAVAAVQPAGTTVEQVAVFVVYRKDLSDFAPLARALRGAVSARTGLEADLIVPVSRIPKTTSGKIQRHKLARALMAGEFDHTLGTDGVRAAVTDSASASESIEASADTPTDQPVEVVDQLVTIAASFVTEGHIGPDDNLFEVGVSSLTLTEIALAIEEQFPGKLDVSDLFDYPTLREIATWVQRD